MSVVQWFDVSEHHTFENIFLTK